MEVARKILIAWTFAITAHIPVPVSDGDNLTSSGQPDGHSYDSATDIDIILLGCDLPDDVDDGPVDDDPEEGNGQSFGVYVTATGRIRCAKECAYVPRPIDGETHNPSFLFLNPAIDRSSERPSFSFGQSCAQGLTALRC